MLAARLSRREAINCASRTFDEADAIESPPHHTDPFELEARSGVSVTKFLKEISNCSASPFSVDVLFAVAAIATPVRFP
jgi:hypothetical protein